MPGNDGRPKNLRVQGASRAGKAHRTPAAAELNRADYTGAVEDAMAATMADYESIVLAANPGLDSQEVKQLAFGMTIAIVVEAQTSPAITQTRVDQIVAEWVAKAAPAPSHDGTPSPEQTRRRLTGLLRYLNNAQQGSRNADLYWVACRAGEMLAAGELTDAPQVADALTQVALRTGLTMRETRATIRSGFRTSGVAL